MYDEPVFGGALLMRFRQGFFQRNVGLQDETTLRVATGP